jgi:hypothetical protein
MFVGRICDDLTARREENVIVSHVGDIFLKHVRYTGLVFMLNSFSLTVKLRCKICCGPVVDVRYFRNLCLAAHHFVCAATVYHRYKRITNYHCYIIRDLCQG